MRVFLFVLCLSISACRPWVIVAPPGFPPQDHYGMPSAFIVRIETDTFYEGYVGTRSISGSMTMSYPIYPGECYMVRKTRIQGLLRTFTTYSTFYQGGNFPKWNDRATTSAFGATSGCL